MTAQEWSPYLWGCAAGAIWAGLMRPTRKQAFAWAAVLAVASIVAMILSARPAHSQPIAKEAQRHDSSTKGAVTGGASDPSPGSTRAGAGGAVVWAVCDKDGKPIYAGTDEQRALNFSMNGWSGSGPVANPIRCVGGPDPSHERVAAVIRAAIVCRAGVDSEELWDALAALTPEDLARFGIVEGK